MKRRDGPSSTLARLETASCRDGKTPRPMAFAATWSIDGALNFDE